ncbi:MAG: thiamine pyrophosphate-dependent dehydrogenase E1 component subunit alpha [Actinomycetota bacterium]
MPVRVEPTLDLFDRLVMARRFEEEIRRLQLSAGLEGAVHLATGQEAVSVGVGVAVGPDDWVACTFRGHGHALARGVPPRALVAEMLGRRTGVCGGLAGSMNIVARQHRLLGSFGIVGGSIAAATGAAISLRDRSAAAIAFFGDGAVNQGYFLECLNLAKTASLPVLYVCENNLYSEYTRTGVVTAGTIRARAEAFGIDTHRVDGMDVRAVRGLATTLLGRIRSGGPPAFVEAETYRFVPHSRADPIPVQPDDEVASWRARDPVAQERARLIDEGAVAGELDAVEAGVQAEIDEAVRAAFEDPYPVPPGSWGRP